MQFVEIFLIVFSLFLVGIILQSVSGALGDDLVAYYGFDETSGQAQDSLGLNHATTTTAIQGFPGKNDKMYNFSGGDTDYVLIPTTYGLQTTSLTINLQSSFLAKFLANLSPPVLQSPVTIVRSFQFKSMIKSRSLEYIFFLSSLMFLLLLPTIPIIIISPRQS